jgi:hypothetical protein
MVVFVYEYACALAGAIPLPECVRVEGRAMRAALVEDFTKLPGVRVLTLDTQTPQAERGEFRALAAKADWTVVIAPEFERILLQRSCWVLEAGGRLLGPSPEIIALTGDKWAIYEWMRFHGIRTPQTWRAEELPPSPEEPACPQAAAKWVLKPRDGAGSIDIQLLHENPEAPIRPGFLLQRFIPGIAASVAYLAGPKQLVALQPAYQHLSNDGRFHYRGGKLPLPEPLAERALRLARPAAERLPEPLGYLGFDLVLGDASEGSADHLIEINPRLTTSYLGLRALAMDNLAGIILRVATGEPVAPLRWRQEDVSFGPDGRFPPHR